MHVDASGFNLGRDYSVSGGWVFTHELPSATFTGVPTGTTHTTSTLVVNPASATGNADLAWFGVNDVVKFWVDEDGDARAEGGFTAGTALVVASSGLTMNRSGDYTRLHQVVNDGFLFGRPTNTPQSNRVTMGHGAQSQATLTAHLDLDDVTIKRDVDGDAGTYNELGANLCLWRDITNTANGGGSGLGDFLMWTNDGATALGYIDKAGQLRLDANTQYGVTTGIMFGDGNTGFFESADNVLTAYSAGGDICVFGTDATNLSITSAAITGKKGAAFTLGIAQQTGDISAFTYNIVGEQASATATGSSMIGGHVDIVGGQGDGSGAAGAAGGVVSVHGGDADPGINASDGGDVKIYGGTLGTDGTPGVDGAVRICDADGSTNVVKVLNGVTQIGAPDGANYATFAADGTLTLAGTARVTCHLDFDNAALGKGATAPAQVVLGTYNGWEYDIGDDSHLNFIIPHHWASVSTLVVKVHWYIDEAYGGGAEVQWRCAWSAMPYDNSEPVDSPTHTGSTDSGDINIPATAKRLVETTLVTIPNASLAANDIVSLDIERIAIGGGTPNPTAKPTIVNVHIEYTSDKLGD